MRRVDLMRLHHHYVFCATVLSLLAEALHKFPPQFTSGGGRAIKTRKGEEEMGSTRGEEEENYFLVVFFISLLFFVISLSGVDLF